ncbi:MULTISPECIES: 50S ribosomal protein L5 [Metallosphaera]|uniref:Large ribosomal subunit protein uL5 n=3 Tax=Metallosphaera TaxID=41980 RepID=A4YCX9_METS5|nr:MULTISPECIES: 50S ribosomal protein L5 [Metallosphaera]ABP94281.1 LSU ribosomal protein L5P [Metallosphaera sedula DSM 5348]AIM26268.1 LSU ribosomal protein L5P [Metallosphaera sedula]AKV73283.1 50S ribosomal protein L5 [Metallosphaera sedula]AKV75527.1 50S ribosomal protein L5 [Metallosphaera sedula]AKV77773.1 50S ribosomal protein L5 [Metallosphaera sedula]
MEQVTKQNPMRNVRIAKVTVNIGLGESGERLQKAYQLVEELTGAKPVYTKAKKSIKEFDVRKGAPIGVMVTLRDEKAEEFLKRVLAAVNYKIKASSFDKHGNVSFGIAEHVVIPGTRYDPEVGIFGLDVAITFERPGFRVSRRKRQKSRIPDSVRVRKEEAMKFLTENFGVTIV